MSELVLHTIHLPHRTDREARLREIERETPGVRFELQLAHKARRPWLACSVGHLYAIYEARLRGDPYVIVAEDDIEFVPGFLAATLRSFIAMGDRAEYDAIYGGTVSYANDIRSTLDNPIIDTDTYLSSHLTVYYARGFEKFLRMPFGWSSDFSPNPVGGETLWSLPHPDHTKRGLVVPFLAIQRDDFSDNCGRELKLAAAWRDAELSWRNAIARGTNRIEVTA